MWRTKHAKSKAALWLRLFLWSMVWMNTGWESSAQTSADLPRPNHVVVVVEENRGYVGTIGESTAPYINELASRGASFTEFYAEAHPSQPNYLVLFSGSTQGVGDDSCPHHFNAPNLGTALLDAGFTFAGYSESLPAAGSTTCESGRYARKHVPWINFMNLPTQTHLPFSQFPSDFSQLPTVAFVTPNLDNDMHSGSTQQGDAWLRRHIDPYVQWAQTNNSLFILTWDEGGPDNRIPTIFIGPMVQPGMYCGRISHYHLLRTLEDMFGLPYAGLSAHVPPIANAWRTGSPPPTVVITNPADGTMFSAPTNLELTAEASMGAGATSKVEFFAGVTKLGEVTGGPPYSLTWSNVPPRQWCITAKVTDEQGGMSASSSITITVRDPAANPFLVAQGAYAGLFLGPGEPAFTNSGFFTLNVTAPGAFSGRLTMGGAKYALRGKFDQSGSAAATVKRPGQTSLTLELNLDLLHGTDKINGTVTDGSWIAALEGDRNVHPLAVPQAGHYTLLIPGGEEVDVLPRGYGAGTLSVDTRGLLKFSATLGDGTHASQTVLVSKGSRWPFYSTLYGGRGAIFGWVAFARAPDSGFQGDLIWFKPPLSSEQLYPEGFAAKASVTGSTYQQPTAGVRDLDWTNGVAVLAGGNLIPWLTNSVTLETNNTLTVSNSDVSLSLKITPLNGLVTGSFVDPVTLKTVQVQGVVQQKLGIIGGLFLGTNQTGSLVIQ